MSDTKKYEDMTPEERKKYYEDLDNRMQTLGVEARDDVFASPDDLIGYLKVQGRFDRISVNNALLIYRQKPDATDVRSAKAWKDDNVYVKKGADGILQVKREQYPLKNGDKIETRYRYVTYKAFDISQTNCQSIKEKAPDIELMYRVFDEMESERFETEPTERDTTGKNLSEAILMHLYTLLLETETPHSDLVAYCATISISEKLGIEVSNKITENLVNVLAQTTEIADSITFKTIVLETARKEGRDFLAMFRPRINKASGSSEKEQDKADETTDDSEE